MRPTLLNPYFRPITSLPGVGSKVSTLIQKVLGHENTDGEPRFLDLVQLLPHNVIDRRNQTTVAQARDGEIATLLLTIDKHQPPPRIKKRLPYRVLAHDVSSEIQLTFFQAQPSWLEKRLPPGSRITVSGRVEWYKGRASMIHPEFIVGDDGGGNLPLVEPVYPSTKDLSAKVLKRAIDHALRDLPELPEWINPTILEQQGFPSYRAALQQIHHPSEPSVIALDSSCRKRLAYDELLAGQLSLALVRLETRKLPGRALPRSNRYTKPLLAQLPFKLTEGQQQAIAEISRDMSSKEPMLRLLQGDVGAGKTVVALLAMIQAAECGSQSALMTPTEILARQHYSTIKPLLERIGLTVDLLTGREKGKERQAILDRIRGGETAIVIGTHALIQDHVEYHDLVLAVIDEQHRFGVHQRLQLKTKGAVPDLLVMTATPIPRTLVLTVFGDMDVSRLMEKPRGRQQIVTATLSMERFDELINRIGAALANGEKIYWVCPLVEDSVAVDLMPATVRFETLQQRFGDCVGLVHGKMKGKDKDAIMSAFYDGTIKLLVATTVVEVGVDVPDATIIIIEHAERFGLAQLHQLRGRVGRSDKASSCILLFKPPLSKAAFARLNIMRHSQDGFKIAEEDLRLRGEGDLLGTKQSGIPEFKFVDLTIHDKLLQLARSDALSLLESDPALTSPRGRACRLLLYIFRRDEAVKFLLSG